MPGDAVRFGDGFGLDWGAYELRRSGRVLNLERIPMEILLLLVERRGQLVAREDIIERIWGKDVFLDTDSSINSAIRKIRQVLKDDPENPIFVQTVTGKGYRFIAPVTEDGVASGQRSVAVDDPAAQTQEIEPGVVVTPSRSAHLRRWRWMVPLAALTVLFAAAIYMYVLYAWVRSHSAIEPHRIMLAVLPFANLSNDPEQEYFSDGLTEETITDLGELNPSQLGVIARTSAMAYKHTNKTTAEIGRELGADYILEGSVRREGDTARVSSQLIRVKDQSHVWAHNYERETGGVLAIEDELGRAIAQQVQVKLTEPHGARSANKYAVNPEAYELYLEGRFYLNKRTFEAIDKSTEYFRCTTHSWGAPISMPGNMTRPGNNSRRRSS
jgi:TolB-like protein/DNA-binding winged helix-turn-helix (wHTH) protein